MIGSAILDRCVPSSGIPFLRVQNHLGSNWRQIDLIEDVEKGVLLENAIGFGRVRVTLIPPTLGVGGLRCDVQVAQCGRVYSPQMERLVDYDNWQLRADLVEVFPGWVVLLCKHRIVITVANDPSDESDKVMVVVFPVFHHLNDLI
jgi:hypothetical protein